jgi:hypothetical protein
MSILSEGALPSICPAPAGLPDYTGHTLSPADHDRWVEFEERAAILEYDGGFSREEAEVLASREVYGR